MGQWLFGLYLLSYLQDHADTLFHYYILFSSFLSYWLINWRKRPGLFYRLFIIWVETGLVLHVKIVQIFDKEISGVISVLITLGNVVEDNVELLQLLALFVWVLCLVREHFHHGLVGFLVNENSKLGDFIVVHGTKSIKKEAIVNLELLAPSFERVGLFLGLKTLSLHVVHQ